MWRFWATARCRLPAVTRLLEKNSHREWIDSFRPLADEEDARVIQPAIHPHDGPLLMGEVVNAVAEATGGDAVLVNDVGQNQMFSCRYFRYNSKRSVVTSGRTRHYGVRTAGGCWGRRSERLIARCVFSQATADSR